MNVQEENWVNLFGQYTEEGTTWHALTTVYSPEQEVIRINKFTRKFRRNADGNTIYQDNTYYLADGTVNEKSWVIEKAVCNLTDGLFHPAAENMRAISFDKETRIWVAKNIGNESSFAMEVFFKQQNQRYSIIPIYKDAKLDRLSIIKDNSEKFPDRLEEDKITNLAGKWHLERIKVKPNLEKVTEKILDQEIDLNLAIENNSNYYLPGKIFINLPKIIPTEQGFEIIIGQQKGEKLYKQIKIQYDATGQLSELIAEFYT